MDMGNIVLHMLDQVHLVPSLVPKYVQCCQPTYLPKWVFARKKKFKPTFFPALTRIWPALMPKIARTPWGVGNAVINMFEEICSVRAFVTMRPWQCENEKIDLQERRELYDLESLWTVGAEFDDATRLHIFFWWGIHYWDLWVKQSKQNMNQCLARSKTSYFSKYSCPIWIENNWRLDWVTRIMFILSL